MSNAVLEMKHIKKSFGATKALNDVSFTVYPGEVHMLLGENGAGKSTLMKILAGSLRADSGQIFWEGKEVLIKTPSIAHQLGIGMVYQELALVEQMNVMENVLMGNVPRIGNTLFIDWKKAEEKSKEILNRVGLGGIDIRKRLSEFTLGIRQLIEIAKALSRDAKLLILDEPTSALTDTEVNTLFDIIENLKKQGVAFIFITHKMEEVFRIGNSVSILRDGDKIGETKSINEVNEDEMIHDMVGRVITDFYPKERNATKEVLLEVKGLSDDKNFHDVSFHVNKGEVLGIAGLVGSGSTEMMEALFGLRPYTRGTIVFDGKERNHATPRASLQDGIGMLTKSRQSSLLLHMPIYQNVTVSNTKDFVTGKIFRLKKKELEAGEKYKEKLQLHTRTITLNAGSLSGGNQQKVVIAKLLCANCKLFIMDDPTRGIDVGAKVEVYNILNELTRNGCGVILISSEMPELISMSDRIIVARRETISGELEAEECTQEKVMKKIAGGTDNE